MIEISVVSPVYHGELSVEELVRRVQVACESIVQSYEIILVEDGSPDGSWEKIETLMGSVRGVKGIRLSRNFGQHYAIAAGLARAKGRWVVVMDCDLQDRPEEIPFLYKKALEGFDLVVARRTVRLDSFTKRMFSKVFYWTLSWLTDTEQNSETANFGIYSRKVIDTINSLRENFKYFPVMTRWVGFKRVEIEVEHARREHGKSSYKEMSHF